MSTDYLPIAVRAYTERAASDGEDQTPSRPRSPAILPNRALVLDTETTTDSTQRLTFGSYRYLRLNWGSGSHVASCVEEGFFHGDDLPHRDPKGLAILRDYAAKHRAEVVSGINPRLRLMSSREFAQAVLYTALCVAQATLVVFNMLFDITRVARNVRPASGTFESGFSIALWEYQDKAGTWRENKYRPRIRIKTIDSKRAIKGFAVPRKVSAIDLVAQGGDDEPQWLAFGGPFLDLRQVIYTLTDRSHTLESACKTFGVPYVKRKVQHGRISPEYITYNREDVWATTELYLKAMEEYIKCCPSA